MLCAKCGGSLRSASSVCAICGHPVGVQPGHEPFSTALPGANPIERMPARPKSRRWAVVAGGVTLTAVVAGFFFVFRPLSRSDQIPILLTVITNPKAQVKILPLDPTRTPIDLGDTPIDKASGAMVGDRVVVENVDLCFRKEEQIQFGEPYKEKIIEHIFGEGLLKLTWTPGGLTGLSVWCNDQRIGMLGAPLKLYEGRHALEVRGDGLKGPVRFEVNIEKDKINAPPKPIDLTPELDPAH